MGYRGDRIRQYDIEKELHQLCCRLERSHNLSLHMRRLIGTKMDTLRNEWTRLEVGPQA